MALPEDTILENRYRIDRLLGQGGMGAIYRGLDTKLRTQVAIKENFFHTPQSIRQFEQEALLLARLHHPNLPRVIDHFNFEGQQYLVMDYIDGQDLWEMVKRQEEPLPEAQALEYLIQICGAVSYLHAQQPPIIHRDIKPQNIKITPQGEAMLVDFGIAKVAEGGERTSTGAKGVTPGFSPPEQYSGQGTDARSDIYALGATLYAILTAQKPPDSVSLMVGGAKFQSPESLNPRLSRAVSQAIIHAMQPQPVQRPVSVAAWQAELAAVKGVRTQADSLATRVSSPGLAYTPMASAVSSPAAPAKRGVLWWGLAALIITVAGLAGFFFITNNSKEPATATVILVAGEPPASTPTPVPTATIDTEATIAAAVAATRLAEPTTSPTPEPSATPTVTFIPPTVTRVPTATPIPEATATPVPELTGQSHLNL